MFQLLEECTVKLGLTSSAKKMFLLDGTEVKDVHELERDQDVYVSCGQPFRDPLKAEKGEWITGGFICLVNILLKKYKLLTNILIKHKNIVIFMFN